MRYLKKDELLNYGLYEIKGKYSNVGIWSSNIGVFYIMVDNEIFTENHYDIGYPYGTAKPLKLKILFDDIDFEDHVLLRKILS